MNQEKIYNRFFAKPEPLFIFEEKIIPAATLWVGIRAWVDFFRTHKFQSGDRILLALPESPAFLHILFASIWLKLTLCIIKPELINEEIVSHLDPKLIFSNKPMQFSYQPDLMGLPSSNPWLREQVRALIPEIRFILKSSGTTSNPKFICLTEEGVESILNSHVIIFENSPVIALSVLPWSHAFGLVLDLLLLSLHGDMIVRDSESGKNIHSILDSFAKYEVNHFSSVPILFEKLLETTSGKEKILSLQSGIIGGASITKILEDHLHGSNLRVGYGQTEASPGICLGKKGVFLQNYIGKPLGCEVQIKEDNELCFRGVNSFFGYWLADSIQKHSLEDWVETGDYVFEKEDKLFFSGRKDFSFKLSNGIFVQPELIETEIKLKISSIRECLIFLQDSLIVLYVSEIPEIETELLKFLNQKFRNQTYKLILISEKNWIYTPKGETNRKEMIHLSLG